MRRKNGTVKVNHKKDGSRIEAESKRGRVKISLVRTNRVQESLTFARIERETLKSALQSNQSFLCSLRSGRYRGKERPDS